MSAGLSRRGAVAAEAALQMAKAVALLGNQYSRDNPSGVVIMGIAENTLMQEELKQQLNQNLDLQDLDFTYGDSIVGSTRLQKALCNLFNRYFSPVTPVLPEHIVTGGGLSAVVDQTSNLLCDPGDAVLIARPYYNGFDVDLAFRSHARVVGVDIGPSVHPGSPSALEAFESAYNSLASEGITTRAVMLCNPHNPLGFNYPRETIVAYAKFCEKHDLHLLSDEIYALSQFQNSQADSNDKVAFTSAFSIDFEKEGVTPARVHVLYGMSKDFCANGLRLGVMVTQHNPALRQAYFPSCIMMKASSAADALWSWMLIDDQRLDDFVRKNQMCLAETFKYCQQWFDARRISYFQATTSLFVFVDLYAYLRDTDDDGRLLATDEAREQDLQMSFLKVGLFLAAGYQYHHTRPGFFRMTFSLRREVLEVGLQRLGQVLDGRQANIREKKSGHIALHSAW